MVAPAPLGDIVQQRRDEQRAAALEPVDLPAGTRMLLRQRAFLDRVEEADRADGMLVHRVVVIHVELHLRVDPPEIGHEAAEHARLVHPPQHGFGVVAPAQQIEEQGVGAWGFAHLVVDQPAVAIGLAHGARVDLQLLGLGHLKDLDQADRVLAEPVVTRRGQLAGEGGVAADHARARVEPGEQAAPRALLRELFLQLAEEHAGQRADPFGLQEIVLHEPLDRGLALPVGEVHPPRDSLLQIEGQPIFRPPGDFVEVAAHRQQKALRAAEAAVLGLGEKPCVDQLGGVAHAVDILADPVQRLKVAQAPLALLHIGFDHVARVAHPLVPGIALAQLVGDELPLRPVDHLGVEAPPCLFVKRLVAPQVAAFEQGGEDRAVGFRHAHDVVHRAHRMADGQAQIPHQVEDRLDQLDRARIVRPLDEEGDVDVGMRGEFFAPVAAGRDQRDRPRTLALWHGGKVVARKIVDQPQQLIDQEALPPALRVPGRGMFGQPARQFRPPVLQRLAQQGEHCVTRAAAIAVRLADRFTDPLGELAPVDDGALVGEWRSAQAAAKSLLYCSRSALRSIFCVPSRGRLSCSCQIWAGRLNGGSCFSRKAASSASLRLAPSRVR